LLIKRSLNLSVILKKELFSRLPCNRRFFYLRFIPIIPI
jgi:hypothetical protein